MKRIFNWGLLAILFLAFLGMYSFPSFVVKKGKNDDQNSVSSLRIENNTIYFGDRELYRFVPVDGGSSFLGGSLKILVQGDTTATFDYRKKYVDSFLLGETPVTKDLWEIVMNEEVPSNTPGYYIYVCGTASSWDVFIERLSMLTGREFRLPTKEEWEYAARGGNKSHGYKYAGSDDIDEVAFCIDNLNADVVDSYSRSKTFGLGKLKKANELGFFDMSGGVKELSSSTLSDISESKRGLVEELRNRQKNGETLSDKDLRLLDFYTSRIYLGGSFDSTVEECSLDHIPNAVSNYTGARIVMIH